LIVIFVDNIENFVDFLETKRIMDEIFYEFKEVKRQTDLSSEVEIEIILHFLSKIEESYLTLYETKLTISKSSNSDSNEKVIVELKKLFETQGIKLVKGKIREIFLSYST